MNNPFLSDRNIFSKVVNPLKKKSEDKKEDPRPDPPRLSEKPKEVLLDTYNPYKNDRPQANAAPKPNPFASQTQKFSFSRPSEPEKAMEKPSNPRSSEEESESETHVYNYGKDSLKFQSESKPTEKWRGGQGRQEVLSPPQEHRFEEFRRNNNFEDCSPINAPRMRDSEFLNIDALGDDLNRFLAESKNQDELCKILGIERNNKPARPVESSGGRERGQDSRGFNEMPRNQYESKADSLFAKPAHVQSVQESQNYMPRVPAIFSKERKVDNVRAEQPAPTKAPTTAPPARQQEQTLRSSNEHIPTFNFGGLEQEHSTVSQEEEGFSSARASRKGKQSKKGKEGKEGREGREGREAEEPLEVFNYSKAGGGQGGESLEEIVEREMRELSLNGKYRTFLSASEKITTVRYKPEPL